MKNLKSFTMAATALFAFLLMTVTEEVQGQVTSMYRGSIKDHMVKPPRLKKRPPLSLPDGLLEVSREHLLKKVPPCDISPAERIGIIPLPSPMPVPGYRRIGVMPLPSPSPRSSRGRVSIAPLPSPMPIPGAEGVDSIIDPIYLNVGPVASQVLLDDLIDMHADAVRRGDLGGADLLEELIVTWSNY